MSVLPRANVCLALHLAEPGNSVYLDPRMFAVWVQNRNLKEYLILSLNKKKDCRVVRFKSKDPERMQTELIQKLREDYREAHGRKTEPRGLQGL
jgi:hypothetical protein